MEMAVQLRLVSVSMGGPVKIVGTKNEVSITLVRPKAHPHSWSYRDGESPAFLNHCGMHGDCMARHDRRKVSPVCPQPLGYDGPWVFLHDEEPLHDYAVRS